MRTWIARTVVGFLTLAHAQWQRPRVREATAADSMPRCADPGSPVSRLPFRFGPQGEARPLEEGLGTGRREERAGDRAGQARRKPALGAGRVGRDAPQVAAARGREGRAARLDRRRRELGHRSDRSVPGDDQPPGRPRLVVASAGASAAAADGPAPRAGCERRSMRLCFRSWKPAGLSPAPEAEKRQLIRRLSFDLTGLPPTPEEVDAFLNDDSPDAYERLVDRYLASPQYGVRWARWWLDLARYGESNGFEFDEFRPNAWRYRDWVVDALNRDRPYDEFARLQLAGDVLRPDDPGAVEATGFLVAGAYDTAGQNQQSLAMKAVVRSDELEDMIGTVGQTFLGLTVNCARCHDHKFDPIRQVEYYRIASASERGPPWRTRPFRDRPGDDALAEANRVAAGAGRGHRGAGAGSDPGRRAARPLAPAPTPWAAWDFDRGLDDRIGSLKVALQGSATLTPEGLRLDGKTGYAVSAPLPRELKAKTIEVWVRLDNLEQRGGGAISIQTRDGGVFDAIVFGEQEAGVWMAGSEVFAGTSSVGGKPEKEAMNRAVHVAITYADDGTIRVFRDGRPYGTPYKSSGPATFPAGEAQVVFGLRHAPAGGNRMLAGTIVRARVYDRALDESEVAASAATFRRLRRSTGDRRRPDSRMPRGACAAHGEDREAPVVACRSARARPTPCRRERRGRRTSRSAGIPTSPATW